MVEQGTHKPLVGGSNPPSATNPLINPVAGVAYPSPGASNLHEPPPTARGPEWATRPKREPTLYSTHGDARRRLFHPEAPSLNPKFFRNGIVMLVLVVGTAALLFTWLTSSAPTTDTSYSEFLQNVEAGQVAKVVQEDNKLTVTPPGVRHDVHRLRARRARDCRTPTSIGDMSRRRRAGQRDARARTPTRSSPSPTTRGSGCC